MTRLVIASDPGPREAPASAAGVGVRDATCLRYELTEPADAASESIAAPLTGRTITEEDELVWNLFPAFDAAALDVRDGFRAAAVALDVLTREGTRLLAAMPRETDGTASAAAARPDLDFPDQWNERRISLAPLAGHTIEAVHLVADPPPPRDRVAPALEGWVDGIRIERSRSDGAAASPSDRVHTTRGSHSSPARSRGLTAPITGVPHGGLHVAPATDLSNPFWTYSWNAHGPGPDPALAGMLLTRSPSIWIGDRGALALRIGLERVDPDGLAPEPFRHEDESARPHRYDLTTASGIAISAAATDHAAIIEARLPRSGRLILCAPGAVLVHASVRARTAQRILLDVVTELPSPHEPDPLRAYHSVALAGEHLTVVHSGDTVVVDVEPGSAPVRAHIGSSQLSAKHAAAARTAIDELTVDDLAERARARWDALLRIVEPIDATDETRMLLASDAYRLFLYPTRHDEDTPDGPRYPSPTARRRADDHRATGRLTRTGRMLTNNGFWDTYRTAWPAYALLAPARAGALLDGMLEHVRDSGWSPRWTAGTPLDAMVGTSLDVIAADLVEARVPGIDLETAYRAALRNATAASPEPRFGRRDMPGALRRGYVGDDIPESVSWTLEGAISDAGAAVLARALARRATGAHAAQLHTEARYLAHRALAYRTLWDPETGFFRPRHADGTWADEPFDPRRWGGAHTETNGWGSRFASPHDGGGLAHLFGGPARLGDALDAYFTEPETARAEFAGTYPGVIHEMPEARDVRRGMWGLSNQPAHHVPWMYAHSDRPWRTDEVLGDAAARMFRGIRLGQGFPGDEDNGEMSAWHLFTTLGFAPFAPGSGRLLVTAPQVARVRLSPDGGAPLEIVTSRSSERDRFIRSVRRNGVEWTSPTIGIADLHEGGRWDVELGAQPVAWCDRPDPRPHFAPDGVDRVALVDAVDRWSGPTRVDPGSVIEVDLRATLGETADALLVIGLREPGRHSFVVDAGGCSTHFGDEEWPWAEQARPFSVTVPGGTRQVRITWASGRPAIGFVQLLVEESSVASTAESSTAQRSSVPGGGNSIR